MRTRLVAVVVLGLLAAAVAVEAQGWVRLGARNVSDRNDHDVVPVTGRQGQFNAVRFAVRGHDVDFHRVVIHYGDGEDQVVQMRETIRAGRETRAIDLERRNRVIRSIEFWWDANTFGRGGRATVTVFGRR